jgi:hypothetical protein
MALGEQFMSLSKKYVPVHRVSWLFMCCANFTQLMVLIFYLGIVVHAWNHSTWKAISSSKLAWVT